MEDFYDPTLELAGAMRAWAPLMRAGERTPGGEDPLSEERARAEDEDGDHEGAARDPKVSQLGAGALGSPESAGAASESSGKAIAAGIGAEAAPPAAPWSGDPGTAAGERGRKMGVVCFAVTGIPRESKRSQTDWLSMRSWKGATTHSWSAGSYSFGSFLAAWLNQPMRSLMLAVTRSVG